MSEANRITRSRGRFLLPMPFHRWMSSTPRPDGNEATMLAERASDIEDRLAAIEAAAINAAGGIGFGKRVGEGTNIAVERFSEVAIHDGLQRELATIRRAEAKLATGDRNRCDSCAR